MTTPRSLTLFLMTLLAASCADTIGAPGQWTFDDNVASDGDREFGGADAGADVMQDAVECALSTCGEVLSCFRATCADSGACEVVPAPSGTPCDDNDFCSVLSTCDGAGACVDGRPARMYATTDDALKLTEVLVDGRMFLVGSRLRDNRWRPVAAMLAPDGSLSWEREFDSSGQSLLTDAVPVSNGWFIVGQDGADVVLRVIDQLGSVRWSREIAQGASGGSPHVVQFDGESVLVAGSVADGSEGQHGSDAWVRRTRIDDGTDIWTHDVDTPESDQIALTLPHDGRATLVNQRWDYDIDGHTSNETARTTWLLELSADGVELSRRDLFSAPYAVVVWGDAQRGAVELATQEPVPGEPNRRTVLRRIAPDESIEEVAILDAGSDSVSVASDTLGRLVLLKGRLDWSGYTIVERWDRTGHRIDTGVVSSPTGDRIGFGPGTFIDQDTMVVSGNIHAAQSSYAWSRAGTAIVRVRPFHHADCSNAEPLAGMCLLADEGQSCADGNPCTADLCDVGIGCATRDFYDGKPCGGDRVCHTGECVDPCATTCQPGTGWCSEAHVTICETDEAGCTDWQQHRCEGNEQCAMQGDSPVCASTE